MPYCSIITCKNHSGSKNRSHNVSYHRYSGDPNIKEKWIDATGRKKWLPTKNSTVCSTHFQEHYFNIKKSGYRYLYAEAIPTIDVWISQQATQDVGDTRQDENANNDENEPTTPRKRKLLDTIANKDKIIDHKDDIIQNKNKKIKHLQAQSRRQTKKICKFEDIIKSLQKKTLLPDEDLRSLSTNKLQVEELVARRAAKVEAGGANIKQKYPEALRSFALTLHYYSPKAYMYVRKTFDTCLPHPRTIKKWYQTIDGEPGFTKESLTAIKFKVETATHPIFWSLCLDEMAIRRRIEWDGQKLHGYVDVGTGTDSDFVAEEKEALVFLVTAINGAWKIPVGYFMIDGMSGSKKANLVNHCLENLHETGVKIISLTFDGCTSNVSMVKYLGASVEDNNVTFPHPITAEPICTILDPSHMIKLIRNAYQCYHFVVNSNGKKIKWQYLENLQKLQDKENFHLANKLRKQHIYFHTQKMKVKLATQLFSNSVSESLTFCENTLHLSEFEDCDATVEFLTIINTMFDVFNSRSIREFNYKKPLNERNYKQIFTYLESASQYLKGLKCTNGTLVINSPRKLGFLGFINCCDAIKIFYTKLVQTKALEYLPFYKCSADHLELLFCNIRSHDGSNNNPTSRQFKSIYKKLLIHIEIHDAGNSNCSCLEQISFLNCSSAIERINLTTGQGLTDNEDVNINSQTNEDPDDIFLAFLPTDISEYSLQIISYIAGFVVRAILKRLQCDTCVGALITNEKLQVHNLITTKDKGGLIYPSKDVIEICKKTEHMMKPFVIDNKNFNKEKVINTCLIHFVSTKIFDKIAFHQYGDFPSSNHITDLMKVVTEKYINVRIGYLTKDLHSKPSVSS